MSGAAHARIAAAQRRRWAGPRKRAGAASPAAPTRNKRKLSDQAKSTSRSNGSVDCGIEVRLGDKIDGFLAEENLKSTSEILPWLQEAIARFFPESTYASRLDAPVRQREAKANRI